MLYSLISLALNQVGPLLYLPRYRLLQDLNDLVGVDAAFPYDTTGGIKLDADIDYFSLAQPEMPFRDRLSVVAGCRLAVVDCHLFVP